MKENLQEINDNQEKALKDIAEALGRFKNQKEIWMRKIQALEAKATQFTSDLSKMREGAI
ncbi:hypothetical protein [Aneurinibacillus tyrosinisolvens]|uniref:hypothetical protein n=1 Tax=Aneurinibacillus tyrosinisolvens TaxID=1443435 RepID=UPI000A405FCB|nr:hypothetical protein [Aneurinibacillus tyrosinisolvens]